MHLGRDHRAAQYLRPWMEVVPEFCDESPLRLDTLLTWRDGTREAYLLGRITSFEPRRRHPGPGDPLVKPILPSLAFADAEQTELAVRT